MDRSLPLFELKDAQGRLRGTLPVWQRREVLLAVLHGARCPPCTALLAQLTARAAALRDDEVEVLCVLPEGARREGALSDPTGRTVHTLLAALGAQDGEARLAVASRFGALYAALDAHADGALVQALEWVDLAQRQCGECQAPLAWDGA
jgi:peroxiredoxin